MNGPCFMTKVTVTVERMSLEQTWEQPAEEQVVTAERMSVEQTWERPAEKQVVASSGDPTRTNPRLVGLEKCKALVPTGNTTEIQWLMDLFEALGGELNEHWYAALVCACFASTPPNQDAAERAFHDMVIRGLKVEHLETYFTRVVGHERFAQLLQTPRLQGKYQKTPRTSSKIPWRDATITDEQMHRSYRSKPSVRGRTAKLTMPPAGVVCGCEDVLQAKFGPGFLLGGVGTSVSGKGSACFSTASVIKDGEERVCDETSSNAPNANPSPYVHPDGGPEHSRCTMVTNT